MCYNIKVLEVSEILFPRNKKSLKSLMLPMKKFGLSTWLEPTHTNADYSLFPFLSECICHPDFTAVPPASNMFPIWGHTAGKEISPAAI